MSTAYVEEPDHRVRLQQAGSEATAMKDWPDDGSTLVFDDLVEACRSAFLAGARWHEQPSKTSKGIAWTGPDLTSGPPAEALLSAEWLTDRRRTYLEVILGIAVTLGIEQGRRIERRDTRAALSLARAHLDGLRSVVDSLTGDGE